MRMYVGLDVNSKTGRFVIEAEDGREVARGEIKTAQADFLQLRHQHALTAETPVALQQGDSHVIEALESHLIASFQPRGNTMIPTRCRQRCFCVNAEAAG